MLRMRLLLMLCLAALLPGSINIDKIRIEKVGDAWVAMAGTIRRAVTWNGRTERYYDNVYRRTRIALNPDFEAGHSFELSDVREGWPVRNIVWTNAGYKLTDEQMIWHEHPVPAQTTRRRGSLIRLLSFPSTFFSGKESSKEKRTFWGAPVRSTGGVFGRRVWGEPFLSPKERCPPTCTFPAAAVDSTHSRQGGSP